MVDAAMSQQLRYNAAHRPNSAPSHRRLQRIAAEVRKAELAAPIALVIGEVVALRDQISWFDTRPLFGKRILVTRARSQASRLASGLTELGAEVIECPVIRSTSMQDTTELDAALVNLGQYEWAAFASPNGVNQAFDRMRRLGFDARAFANCKIAAVGPATVSALKSRGIDADMTPDTFTAEGLVESFRATSVKPKNAVVFRSDIGRETIPRGLRQLGADVTEVATYRTILEEDSAAIARAAFQEGIDVVTFTSSSTVKNLRTLLDGDVSPINKGVVVCMGPVTASTAESFGHRSGYRARRAINSRNHRGDPELLSNCGLGRNDLFSPTRFHTIQTSEGRCRSTGAQR